MKHIDKIMSIVISNLKLKYPKAAKKKRILNKWRNRFSTKQLKEMQTELDRLYEMMLTNEKNFESIKISACK